MARNSAPRRTLEKACSVAGGVQKLAGHLHVPIEPLERFLDGREDIPTWLFLRAVDLLHEFEEALYRQMYPAPGATVHVLKTKP